MPETTKKTKAVKKKIVKNPVKKTVLKTTTKTITTTVKKPVPKKRTTTVKKTIKKPVKKVVKKIVKKRSYVVKRKETNKVNFIKGTFLDVFKLYKNFIHWNIIKIIVLLFSLVLGFILLSPLIIYIGFSQGLIDSIMSIKDLLRNLIYFIFTIFLINLNLNYIEGKKLGYKINNYVDFKKIVKTFNLTFINSIILIIPAILFYIIISLMIIAFGGQESVTNIVALPKIGFFQITSLALFVLTVLLTIYLLYRIIFSYFILFDFKKFNNINSVIDCIKKSFSITNKIKIFLKYAVIFLMFLFLLSPVNYLGIMIKNNNTNLNVYYMYLGLSEEQKNTVLGDNLYYIEALKLKYKDLDINEINKNIKLNNLYIILFTVLNFIFLSGLFVMVTSSFYRRELT